MVARRVIPLVVACAMAFAPVALVACQASCLSYGVEAAGAGVAHHHHAHSVPAPPAPAGHLHHHGAGAQGSKPGVVTISQSQCCEHGDEVPAFSAAQNVVPAAPAIAIATFEFPHPRTSSVRAGKATAARASERIVPTTHLRV